MRSCFSSLFFVFIAVTGCGQKGSDLVTPSLSFQATPFALTRGVSASVIPSYLNQEKPVSCQVVPALPDGLVLNSDCSVTGVPVVLSEKQTYTFQATFYSPASIIARSKTVDAQALLEVSPAFYAGSPGPVNSHGAFYQCASDGSQCRKFFIPQEPGMTQIGTALSANQFGVFVGAKDIYNGQPVFVYRCSLPIDGQSCVEVNIPWVQSEFAVQNYNIFATQSALFVSIDAMDAEPSQIYKCDARGENCALLKDFRQVSGRYLQVNSLFVTSTNVFLGMFDDNDATTSIWKCDLAMNNCTENASSSLATSLFVNKNDLYFSNNQQQKVFKCDTEGQNCSLFSNTFDPALPAGSYFGSSLFVQGDTLYAGAPAFGSGKVYQCQLGTGACSEFKADIDDAGVGSSLIFY